MSALTNNVALVSDTPLVNFGEISTVAAALQKQVTRDFGPIWNVNATVNAYDKLESVPVDYWPVIIRDDINQPGAAGYHTDNNGQPFSLVQADQDWALTASHETLEMLADPFGNRTLAGTPPPQTPDGPVKDLERVVYLVEVCDPCELGQFGYSVNGVAISDFITPHYYDPSGATGAQYSFRGNVKAPHTVLEGGYVSFGNPIDNNWYQIIVQGGKVELHALGVLNAAANGKSLREQIDAATRQHRRAEHYRTNGCQGCGASLSSREDQRGSGESTEGTHQAFGVGLRSRSERGGSSRGTHGRPREERYREEPN